MHTPPAPPAVDADLLGAWLDQQLSPAERERVDAWLASHPDDAARVHVWAAQRDALRAQFDPVLSEPVPERLHRTLWRHLDGPAVTAAPTVSSTQPGARATPAAAVPRWHRAPALAAGVALLLLGGALGAAGTWRWAVADTRAQQSAAAAGAWVQRAALAHSVYTPEVRHPVEVAVAGVPAAEARAQEEHLARWLTKRLDVPVRTFDLRAQGYELVGGRLLPDDTQGPSAQLMYQRPGAPAGSRVTVYLRAPDARTPAAFRYERHGELGLFYWVDGATGYALVGALPREQLLTLAAAIDRQLSVR